MQKVYDVWPGSIAEEGDVRPGDELLSVNGQKVRDVLHYRELIAEEEVALDFMGADGEEYVLDVEKDADEDIGILFENELMDRPMACRNRCIFCFIEQMPPGMRQTLYFKDDDYRLGFLNGNYLSLTNLDDNELNRIVTSKLSPLYVSVHTTDGDLRAKMLKNPEGAKIMERLTYLLKNGIDIHCQIVLVKGWNDGVNLMRTLSDLKDLRRKYEGQILTVAIVPVGLTKYREGLEPLEPFNAEECRKVISLVERMQEPDTLIYPSDEFYVKGGLDTPPVEFYGDFSQIEDGVGITTLVKESFRKFQAPKKLKKSTKALLLTGVLAEPVLKECLAVFDQTENLSLTLRAVENDFFGHTITVAGLLTGGDLYKACTDSADFDRIIIPDVMLHADGTRFLDDMTLDELNEKLGGKLRVVELSADGVLNALEERDHQ